MSKDMKELCCKGTGTTLNRWEFDTGPKECDVSEFEHRGQGRKEKIRTRPKPPRDKKINPTEQGYEKSLA